MPGGGEIFHPEIEIRLPVANVPGDQWLQIHEIWHELGGKSNATMLYGHIEKYWHRVDHLDQLRQLQDKTVAFKPLFLSNSNKGQRDEPSAQRASSKI